MRSSAWIIFMWCTIWVKISKDDPLVLKGGVGCGSVWFCTVWPPQSTSYDFEVLPSAPQLVCGCVNAGEVAERIFLRCLTILVPQNDSLQPELGNSTCSSKKVSWLGGHLQRWHWLMWRFCKSLQHVFHYTKCIKMRCISKVTYHKMHQHDTCWSLGGGDVHQKLY